VQTFYLYDRSQPLACDTHALTSTLVNCHWDTVQYCLIADNACRVQFHVNLLWLVAPAGSAYACLIMLNQLGTPVGGIGGEIAGTDRTQYNAGANFPQSGQVTRILDLNPGDKVWAVPCLAAGPTNPLTNAVASNGNNTVNYVEVIEIT
jgi:hypothetical protein